MEESADCPNHILVDQEEVEDQRTEDWESPTYLAVAAEEGHFERRIRTQPLYLPVL